MLNVFNFRVFASFCTLGHPSFTAITIAFRLSALFALLGATVWRSVEFFPQMIFRLREIMLILSPFHRVIASFVISLCSFHY